MKLNKVLVLITLFSLNVIALSAQKSDLVLNVLQTSDVHSRIEPISQKGDRNYNYAGFVRRATFVDQFRKNHANVLLFDCGDFSQGTPYYNLFKGELEVKLMNEMKYDAMTIGNHEFDFGMENMARIYNIAQFPVVCSNYDLQNTPLKDIVKPYLVIHRNGLKIGVLGLGANPDGLIQQNKCEGLVFQDPAQRANDVAKKLLDMGCDVVICLSHLGYDNDLKLIEKSVGIDVVLGGHSHTFMDQPKMILNSEGKEVVLMHSGKNGINVGSLVLTFKHK